MKKLTLSILVISCQLLAASYQAKAQYHILYDFSNSGLDQAFPGPNALIASVTGDTLFGTTYEGGKYGSGSVFYITADGSTYDTLFSFDGTDEGNYPDAGLLLSGNILYGTTYNGGQYSKGVIFSIHTDGTHFDTLHNFGHGTDGAFCISGLTISSAGVLYGMTQQGGTKAYGTIFSMDTNGTHYHILHNFGSYSNEQDGEYPVANLTLSGNLLYGITPAGGVRQYSDGVIFSIDTNGTTYDTLHSFGWYANAHDGQEPECNLLITGNTLYGLTGYGGMYDYGMAFSMHTDGTHYDTLHSFGGNATAGASPEGSFTLADSVLYSTTYSGGAYGKGVLFSMHTDGTHYDTLHNFGNGTDGRGSNGDLVFANRTLFGTTLTGGAASNGIIFSYVPPLYITTSITNNITCNGGSNGDATANVTGGTSPYTYSWSDGGTAATTNPTGTVLGAGTYTLTVTDYAGNTSTATTVITQPTALAITPSSTPDNGTANGTASVAVSGGTSPYTYSWAPVSASTSSILSLSAGTYTCTVTDANGCGNTATTVTISSSASINEVKGESEKVKVYPNPSSGQFTVVCHSESAVADEESLPVIQIYNVLGENLLTKTLRSTQGDNTINMNTQPDGIYLYRVITHQGNLIGEGKIIIQK